MALLAVLALAACDATPKEYCGDSAVDSGEECDDGNRANADGCEADCTLPACGNDVRDPGEECDDGNREDGDHCAADCTLVTEVTCEPDCPELHVCGDGVLEPPDPLIAARLVYLGAHCYGDEPEDVLLHLETAGFSLTTLIDGPCECEVPLVEVDVSDAAFLAELEEGVDVSLSLTGDAANLSWAKLEVETAEQVADIVLLDVSGNHADSPDGHDPLAGTFDRCQAGSTDEFVETVHVRSPIPEACDDGNFEDDGTCRSDCGVGFCGDGKRDVHEECDADSVEFCEPNCTLRVCGNRRVELGEECDDGNTNDLDNCSNDCQRPTCGDGVAQLGEGCDWDDPGAPDGCLSNCMLETCRNGDLDPGEVCDDGDSGIGDGCNPLCASLEECGNGWRDPGTDEECDDGNDTDGDGCSAACVREELWDCSNARSDDADQLIDCADPECAGTP
ncbi:MAG TPA: hypothetical protein VMZ28_04130, partial [Kofleriaceae bacterium]|nr:hypothetical protein [Kofleriaceae bacterium]